MRTKIENLLLIKKEERQKLNVAFNTIKGYSKVRDLSSDIDKLEAEIDLLELLLKE
jgi:hypothetical protein